MTHHRDAPPLPSSGRDYVLPEDSSEEAYAFCLMPCEAKGALQSRT